MNSYFFYQILSYIFYERLKVCSISKNNLYTNFRKGFKKFCLYFSMMLLIYLLKNIGRQELEKQPTYLESEQHRIQAL